MEKKYTLLIVLIITGFLFGCNASDGGDDVQGDNAVSEATFTGVIEEINGDQALVAIEEGEILRSGDKVMVDLSAADDPTLQAGDRIRVGYDGEVRESYPLGINTVFVERVGA